MAVPGSGLSVNEPVVGHGPFAMNGILPKSPPEQLTNQPNKEPYDEYTS
jgi:hypothetical protein